MKKHLFTISILSVLLLATGCKQTEEKVRHIPTAPQMKARIDRSEPVKTVDVEQAAENPVPLKLSQIASEIEYYTVGDAGSPSPRLSSCRTVVLLSPSIIRASTTGNKAFRVNDMASKHWPINGTTR